MHIVNAEYDIFCDEKPLDLNAFRVSCIAVQRNLWERMPKNRMSLSEPKQMSRLDRICNLLEETNGVGVVASADLPEALMQGGERDTTADLSNIARTDNIWSMAMAFALTITFSYLHVIGSAAKSARIFFDNKDLKVQHWEKIREVIIVRLPEVLADVSVKSLGCRNQPRIYAVENIKKASKDATLTHCQYGIMVAHRLLQRFEDAATPISNRVHLCNITEEAKAYLNNFSG